MFLSNFSPKQSLGQNFIYDTNFLNALLDRLDLEPTDTVIEVGTGAGTLTKCLAPRVASVTSYEVDRRLEQHLSNEFANINNVQIIFKDALEAVDFPPNYIVVANIPYYITTPLIMKFLRDPRCREICVLVQDDVAKRIVAKPGTKEYGALTVTVQAVSDVKIIKAVPRGLFRPVPKVDSSFVSIKKTSPVGERVFDTLVKSMFAARRKTVQNALGNSPFFKGGDGEAIGGFLKDCNIDPTIRPENITVAQYIKLSQLVDKSKSQNTKN